MSELVVEKQLDKNQKLILVMLDLAGGSIERFCRFQIGMYDLSKQKINSYKFDDDSSWGPADRKFREDLNLFCGFIHYRKINPAGKDIAVYSLTSVGKFYAEIFKKELKMKNQKEYEIINKIAKQIGKPSSKVSAKSLYKLVISR